jgi:hypothetical protein
MSAIETKAEGIRKQNERNETRLMPHLCSEENILLRKAEMSAQPLAIERFVDGIEALRLIRDKLGLEGAFWGAIANPNDAFNNFGFVNIGK